MGKLFGDDVSSLDFAEFAIAVMQTVQNGESTAAISAITNDEPRILRTFIQRADGNYPDMLFGAGPNRAVVFIGGAVNLSLAQKFWQGYFQSDTGLTGSVPKNRFTNSLADYCSAKLTELGALPGANGVFIGHSMGGTVAQFLAGQYNFAGGTSRGYYCTFGSPKWARDDVAQQYRQVPGVRWMNDNDPIPLFPFTARDSLTTLLLIPPLLQNTLAHFVQTAGGVQIFANANYEPAVLPTAASVGNLLTYPGYLLGLSAQPLGPHAISEYKDRLFTAAASSRTPTAATRVSVSQEIPSSQTSRYYTQQEQRVATAVSNAQAAQSLPAVEVPRPRLFNYYRQGRVYVLTFGDVSVGLTSDRRIARSICRQFNVAFRHLQTLGFVDPANMVQQLQQYLSAAGDPASGFSPVMNTTLPV